MASNGQTGPRSGTRSDTKSTKTAKITKTFRDVLFVVFVFFVLLGTERQPWAVSASSQQAAANWAQFRGNPTLTGVAGSDVPQTLSLKWTYNAGETIESSAAIAADDSMVSPAL